MNLIDTHCHLDFPDFDKDRLSVINRAKDAGIVRILNVSCSMKSCKKTSELTRGSDSIYGSIGIHPHDAASADDAAISSLKEMAKDKKIVAIGEVGLDYYRNLSPKEKQVEVFLKFISISKELNLPLIIHSRNAMAETLDIIKREFKGNCKGVFHCFSGDEKSLDEILGLGFYVSFTCNITFKNAERLREIVKIAPMDKVLLETDAPFLAPQHLRGKRNEPAYLAYLLDAVSEIKGLSKEEIADTTTRNANRLFKLGI
ncbi:MAG: hydrolase TatD [Candidatus Omnitrophica bacterium CG07_land_8_20_14_0_80_42_15]|uniref:Hydrolase TatD n=1 Tax=Candidatus Aquitaenariimonas noxiae TaxID=1974741 RepID=A0A2J0L0D6_9BACT|nr:MAG: hydrolase TatD [Candidatus Omnitrophica bacterium CG07_land_8_20_14_0_80_42_15]